VFPEAACGHVQSTKALSVIVCTGGNIAQSPCTSCLSFNYEIHIL